MSSYVSKSFLFLTLNFLTIIETEKIAFVKSSAKLTTMILRRILRITRHRFLGLNKHENWEITIFTILHLKRSQWALLRVGLNLSSYYIFNYFKIYTHNKSPNIYLYNADIFDCHMKDRKSTYCEPEDLDPTRVSFYTSKKNNVFILWEMIFLDSTLFSLWRCGQNTLHNTPDFRSQFAVEFWHSKEPTFWNKSILVRFLIL